MVRFTTAVVLILMLTNSAFAWPRNRARTSSGYTTATVNAYPRNQSAQGVAELQAGAGRVAHFGGNSGYEGVGYSSSSADDAIKRCCFWGQRKPKEIGVARGHNGWYACVRYF